ncbi:MAG: hypothetical protein A2Y10_19865 [Planctomycetes bacterium GWF2_41_51]|nr:MAG: hypothetical protein A2Y10_19865 [Planctomycetes bacterium GWF2_41_51]HBG28542.1 hypothetical protein [Phycisphaerales bacterium]
MTKQNSKIELLTFFYSRVLWVANCLSFRKTGKLKELNILNFSFSIFYFLFFGFKNYLICAVVMYFILFITVPFAAAEVLFQNVPFAQGTLSYHTFRIPALIQAPDGTILAFAEGRKNSGSDTGNIDLVLRRSFDGGNTWQSLQIIWDDGGNTCGNPTPVVDESNGRIWLFMTHNLGQDTLGEINDGTSDGVRTIWSCYSDDNGATWSTPVNRFNEVQPADTRWDATGPGNGIQIKQGAHIGRLVIPAICRNIQSDNHGATWTQSGYLGVGGGEGAVVEIGSGTLMRNDRATSPYKGYYSRLVSYSYNQGSTWSAWQIRQDLADPICQGSIISCDPTASQRILLFSNAADTTRIKMTVKMSFDDGYTWPRSKLIFAKHSAYSSLALFADGSVGLFYENGDDMPYRRMTFAKFSLDWLKDRSIFFWDFEEYQNGQIIPTGSNAVEDLRGYGFNGTATASLNVVSGGCGESAVHFDGSGKALKITDSASKDILDFDANEDFVISVIFRTTSHSSGGSSGAGALIAKDVGSNSQSWWLRVQDGKLRFLEDNGTTSSSVVSGYNVNDGLWHEALAVHKGSAGVIELYVDGVLSAQYGAVSGSFANSNDVTIGCFNSGSSAFSGDIDKVAVYRALPQNILTISKGDLNCDSIVDFSDLNILINNWLHSD